MYHRIKHCVLREERSYEAWTALVLQFTFHATSVLAFPIYFRETAVCSRVVEVTFPMMVATVAHVPEEKSIEKTKFKQCVIIYWGKRHQIQRFGVQRCIWNPCVAYIPSWQALPILERCSAFSAQRGCVSNPWGNVWPWEGRLLVMKCSLTDAGHRVPQIACKALL